MSYGVPFVRIWMKIDRIITALHCIVFSPFRWGLPHRYFPGGPVPGRDKPSAGHDSANHGTSRGDWKVGVPPGTLLYMYCHCWSYYPIPWLPTRLALASMATTSNVSSLSICIYVIMQFSFGDPWWYIAGNKLTSTGHFKMGGYTLLKSSCGYPIFKWV